jgi:glycerol uptake facilitator-like aquaporin
MKHDPRTRLFGEFLGTGLLVLAVIGSGAMAEQLTDDVAVQLLANSLATVGALVTLIWMFAPLSGAHFNPVVTISQCVFQLHPWKMAAPYVVVQILGGLSGAMVANLMFSLDVLGPSKKVREGGGIWLGEVVATFSLLLVIHLIGKSNSSLVPAAVGIWIGGAYWFTSSTSLANPAVTIARSFTESFAGISPSSVPMFVAMQVAGLALAMPVIRLFDRRN